MKLMDTKANPSPSATKHEELRAAFIQRLVRGLRAMSKWGLGPSGGGGAIDDWSSGRREAEEKMRGELRRLLKEFDSADRGLLPPETWLDLPDREGWWWKHFDGDEAAHVIRVTAQEVESMRKWGDWRGDGVVIHYLGPIPEPALPNARSAGAIDETTA